MSDRLTQRYNTLQAELDAGKKMLEDLEARRAQVLQTMTRIEGAMMVLRELMDEEKSDQQRAGVETPINGAGL